jgi:hypothetical protein
MTDLPNIDALRQAWKTARSKGLGPELRAYCALLDHPDLTWRDILDGLDRPELIAEQAWLRMRTEFKELEPAAAHA